MEASYYGLIRNDLLALIPRGTRKLLDVGCGEGKTAAEAKRRGVREVFGIEEVDHAAKEAELVLDGLLCNDVENADIPWTGFDCIICADVLEHLKDPWAVLRKLKPLLTADGVLIASIPNIAHISVLKKIIRDRFAYEEKGILDKTHLRFFTKSTIEGMFTDCSYRIIAIGENASWGWRHKLFHIVTLGRLKHCSVVQYLITATHSRSTPQNPQT